VIRTGSNKARILYVQNPAASTSNRGRWPDHTTPSPRVRHTTMGHTGHLLRRIRSETVPGKSHERSQCKGVGRREVGSWAFRGADASRSRPPLACVYGGSGLGSAEANFHISLSFPCSSSHFSFRWRMSNQETTATFFCISSPWSPHLQRLGDVKMLRAQ
jgi:hypothetical protein